MRILLLHPGAMGAAVGRVLVGAGHEVGWLPAGRSVATHERADAAGLRPCDGADGFDVVLSICPPAAAVETARSMAGFTGVYVDANAVSPVTAAAVRDLVVAAGAEYVDGGIVGPPPESVGTTRLYLSGGRAGEFASLFAGSDLEAIALGGGEFAASALKMAYAAWTKISSALLLATWRTAQEFGIAEVLEGEWARSQPQAPARLADALRSAAAKGWRWEDEMRQIASTFAVAGQPDAFGLAAAQVYAAFPRPTDESGA